MWLHILSVAGAGFLVMAGCGCTQPAEVVGPPPSDPFAYLDFDDPLPKFDAYIEWKEYEESHDSEKAVYFWQGKEVGRGEDGFRKVMTKLAMLPERSVILAYPGEWRQQGLGGSSDIKRYPFDEWWGELENLLVKRHLVMVLSARDHLGRILPEFEDAWHLRYVEPDTEVRFDAYYTWKNYDGRAKAEEAVFIWQGQELGKGSDGFRRLIVELGRLRHGSRVLVFPRYNGRNAWSPIWGCSEVLREAYFDVITKNNLIMLESPRDQNGRMVGDDEVDKK
jgi:hypothetical protein